MSGIFNDEVESHPSQQTRILEVYRALSRTLLARPGRSSSPLKLYAGSCATRPVKRSPLPRFAPSLDEYVGLPRDHYRGYADHPHHQPRRPRGHAREEQPGPDGWCAMTSGRCRRLRQEDASRLTAASISRSSASQATYIGFNEPRRYPRLTRTHVGVLTETDPP